ncbi:flavin reductase family protein [Streptomyces sp. NPDC048002]|uniref:flavin reductase family protein n=1 Tax=Streptomyces sp. NPDC048002 TaxID=3154344 RepID=UPI0033C4CC60
MNAEKELSDVQVRFRNAMASVCTPVSVVSAVTNGSPYGTTVSAFASLSLDPPMLLVALDRTSELLAVVRQTEAFGLNVLSSSQSATALTFAKKGGPAKFDGVPWTPENGLPRLHGATCFLACKVAALVEGGDHIVVLGEVVHADAVGTAPLTYHARVFGTHTAVGDTAA